MSPVRGLVYVLLFGAAATVAACQPSGTTGVSTLGVTACCEPPAAGACASSTVVHHTSASLDEDLNDFAAIYLDAQRAPCSREAALALQHKLRIAVEYRPRPCAPGLQSASCGSAGNACERTCFCGGTAPLHRPGAGRALAHAFAAALALRASDSRLPQDLDNLLLRVRDRFAEGSTPRDPSCGTSTNSCIDDHAATAAGFAWIAAYEAVSGRDATAWMARARAAIAAALQPLSRPGGSICHYVVGSIPPRCNGDLVPPSALAGEQGVRLFVVENGQESPGAGLSAMSVLAAAASGLARAGRPWSPTASEKAAARALLEAAQLRAVPATDDEGEPTFVFASEACVTFDGSPAADCDEGRTLGANAHLPGDFPLRRFYLAHGLGPIKATAQTATCGVRLTYGFDRYREPRESASRCAYFGLSRRVFHLGFGSEAWPAVDAGERAAWEEAAADVGRTCPRTAVSSTVVRKCRELSPRPRPDPTPLPYPYPEPIPNPQPLPFPTPIKICPINPGGCGVGSPANLRVVPRTGGFEASWNAVPGATYYDLCWSTSPGACGGTVVLDYPVADATVADIPAGTIYVAVRAKNADCLSPATAEVEVVIPGVSPVFERDADAEPSLDAVVTGLGDLDGDSVAEYGVGVSGASPGDIQYAGSVWIFSGASGALLHRLNGSEVNENLGAALASIGDVDGDKVPDFAVGASGHGGGRGRVWVYSGATRTLLFTQDGPEPYGGFGRAISGGTDADGDGTPDLVVGAPFSRVYAPSLGYYLTQVGAVFLVSGAGGAILRRFDGAAQQEWFGWAVAIPRDLDGDGLADVAVGAPRADSTSGAQAGRISAYSGASGGLLWQQEGPYAGDRFGVSLASLGDADGDGRTEVLAGADKGPGGNNLDVGSVYVLAGSTGQPLVEVRGETLGDQFGKHLAAVGDVDGDQVPDFATGAPYADLEAGYQQGYVNIWSGTTGARIARMAGPQAYYLFGAGVAGADLDGDGRPELLVRGTGFYASYGNVSAYSVPTLLRSLPAEGDGATDDQPVTVTVPPGDSLPLSASGGDAPYAFSLLTDASGGASVSPEGLYTAGASGPVYDTVRVTDALGRSTELRIAVVPAPVPGPAFTRTHDGGASGDDFGYSLAMVGDVNGDGFADYLVGAPNADPGGMEGGGAVTLYSGLDGSVLRQLAGEAPGHLFGMAVAGAGDVDGDGIGDFLVGAPYAGPIETRGAVYVLSGATGARLHKITGGYSAELGTAVSPAGDVNGDGYADFVAGAPGFYYTWPAAGPKGAAFVYSGADGSVLFSHYNAGSDQSFGESVTGGVDLSGDGVPDYVVGVRGAAPGGQSYRGSVFVYSGADGSLVRRFDGERAGDQFGMSLATTSDVDGDGVADLIVGAGGAKPDYSTQMGRAYVLNVRWNLGVQSFDGTQAYGQLGRSVAAAGDVNGDGVPDVVVGAPGNSIIYTGSGEVFVFSGADGTALSTYSGSSWDQQLGISVGGGFDLNGSGVPAVLAGAPQWGNAPGAGQVQVFLREPPETGFGANRVPAVPPLAATATGNDSVHLQWTSPAGATSIRLERRTMADAWVEVVTVDASTTSYDVAGLRFYATHLFRARASNATGDSAWSVPVPVILAEQ